MRRLRLTAWIVLLGACSGGFPEGGVAADPPGGGAGAGGAGGAGGGGGAGGAGGAGGDGGSGLEVLAGAHTDGLPLRVLADGDVVSLEAAPQGGHLLWIGAKVRGLEKPSVRLHATLVDLETGTLLGEAEAYPDMVPLAAEPGWREPDNLSFTTFAMVPLCPGTAPFDLDDRPATLVVEVEELSTGRTGAATVAVTPRCTMADPTSCTCECEAGVTLGKCGCGPPG